MIKNNLRLILLINIFFIIGAVACSFFIFFQVKPDQFLLVHDQIIFLSTNHADRSSFLVNSMDNGIAYGIQYVLSLPNLIFYSILLKAGVSVRNIEIILFPLCLYLLFSLSFIGFFKLYFWEEKKLGIHDWLNILILSLFYCFNLVVGSATGGGLWLISVVISCGLIPLLIYLINKLLFNYSLSFRDAILFSLVLFLSSTYIMIFVPLLITLIFYVFIKLPLSHFLRLDYKKIGLVLLVYLLLFGYFIIAYVLELSFGSKEATTVNMFNSTAGLQSKGILSMFLFYFSWVIYTPWEPRSIFTFYKYYLSSIYITSVLSIYMVIFALLAKQKEVIKRVVPYLTLFIVSVFLGKAFQEPFGFIFDLLLKSNTAFTVIRSPDGKFASIIIFSLTAIFLHLCIKNRKSVALKLFLLFVTLIVSWPFFTGEAIMSKNVYGKSGDWITSINPDYHQVLSILNSDKSIANVVPYPELGYAFFVDDDKNLFIGQNRLAMLSSQPFINPYLLEKRRPVDKKNAVVEYDFSQSAKYNVKYFIIYKNIYREDLRSLNRYRRSLINQLNVKKLVDNRTLELYVNQDRSFVPRLSLKNNQGQISFRYINPVQYSITITNLGKSDDLIFLQSFSKNWCLYNTEDIGTTNNLLSDLHMLLKKPVYDTDHAKIYGYANSWRINPKNQQTIKLILYYKNQSLFNIVQTVSFLTLGICMTYIIISSLKRNQSSD